MRRVNPKKVTQHADPTNSRCAVNLFKKYLSLIPADGPFYKSPINGLRFSKQNIGHNTLEKYMKQMFTKAAIPLEGRNITNHSGKVTLCTNLFNSGYDDKMISERSGHRSGSFQKARYEHHARCFKYTTKRI